MEHDHLVDDASERPDVAFVRVRLVSPHLRARIEWSSCLCVIEAVFTGYFGDVEVHKLRCDSTVGVAAEQNVGCLDISVHYPEIVQALQGVNRLNRSLPYLILAES